MMQIPSFRNKIRSDMKSVRKNHPKKNGKKGKLFRFNRKRLWRSWKRDLINHEYDKRIKYCSPFIEYISKTRNDAYRYGMLYKANHVSILRLESYAFDAYKRFDYIKELVEKYGAMEHITRYATVLSMSAFLLHILFMRCWRYVIFLWICFLKYFVPDLTILLEKK